MGAARGERASPQVALATLLVALLALGAASRAAHLSAAATAVAAGALLCAATGWAALVAAHPRGDGAQCAAELNGAGGGAHKPVGGSSGGKDKQAPHERKGDTWRGGTKAELKERKQRAREEQRQREAEEEAAARAAQHARQQQTAAQTQASRASQAVQAGQAAAAVAHPQAAAPGSEEGGGGGQEEWTPAHGKHRISSGAGHGAAAHAAAAAATAGSDTSSSGDVSPHSRAAAGATHASGHRGPGGQGSGFAADGAAPAAAAAGGQKGSKGAGATQLGAGAQAAGVASGAAATRGKEAAAAAAPAGPAVSLAQSIRDAAARQKQLQQSQPGAAGAVPPPVGVTAVRVAAAVAPPAPVAAAPAARQQPGAAAPATSNAAVPKPSLSARGALPQPKVLPQASTAAGQGSSKGTPLSGTAVPPSSNGWAPRPAPPSGPVQLPPPPPSALPGVGGDPFAAMAPAGPMPPGSGGGGLYGAEWIGMGASIVKLLAPAGPEGRYAGGSYGGGALGWGGPGGQPHALSPPLSPPPSPGPLSREVGGHHHTLGGGGGGAVAYRTNGGGGGGTAKPGGGSSSDEEPAEDLSWVASLVASGACAPTLRAWLDALGLGQGTVGAQALEAHGIGFADLAVLSQADLGRMGVPLAQGRRILAAGAVLRAQLRGNGVGGEVVGAASGGAPPHNGLAFGAPGGLTMAQQQQQQQQQHALLSHPKHGSSASLDLDFKDDEMVQALAGLPERDDENGLALGGAVQPQTPRVHTPPGQGGGLAKSTAVDGGVPLGGAGRNNVFG